MTADIEAIMFSYWIQRADFSIAEEGTVDLSGAIEAFSRHDWDAELRSAAALSEARSEACPPGIGYVDTGTGDLRLHVCPTRWDVADVHGFFARKPSRLWGLLPRAAVMDAVTQEQFPVEQVKDLLFLLFAGDDAALRARLTSD